MAVDGLAGEARTAQRSKVKHLGGTPRVVALTVDGGGEIELATKAESTPQALGPFTTPRRM